MLENTRSNEFIFWNDQALPAQRRSFLSCIMIRGVFIHFPQSALRQAVYLAIKELSVTAEDVIMVTSSIMKDMQPNSEVIYRPNAIRALCKIIDVCIFFLSCFPAVSHIIGFRSPQWHKALNAFSKRPS